MKRNLLYAALFTPISRGRWGLPLILWGDPGIAKTSLVRQIAEQMGLHCEHLAPGERGEGAFGVTPVPKEVNGEVVLGYPAPEWVQNVRNGNDEEAGIIFFDEINCLTGDTQVTVISETGAVDERAISDIKPGALVASFDFQTESCCANKVTHIQHMPASTIVHVQFGNGRAIGATPNHRFYVDNEWIFASKLQIGMKLRPFPEHLNVFPERFGNFNQKLDNHDTVKITSVEITKFDDDVWDLSVEIDHNFYANGILTHNTAPPALQPALLGGIQERRVGGHTFGPRVRVLGAANPVSQAAGGWDIAPPVANRLGHIDWEAPEVDDWTSWLLAGEEKLDEQSAKAEEARVLKVWPDAFAKACGLAAAFVRRRPELLHKMPADGDPAASRAWPSPRSWEYAVRAKATSEVHNLTAIEADEMISAFIGTAAAGEWGTWITEADLPEPGDVLDGKDKFEHNPKRLDRTMAVLSACAALVTPTKAAKRKERAIAMWGLMAVIMDDAKDIVVPAMTAMVRAKLNGSKEARPVLAKMHTVISAAGMTGGRR